MNERWYSSGISCDHVIRVIFCTSCGALERFSMCVLPMNFMSGQNYTLLNFWVFAGFYQYYICRWTKWTLVRRNIVFYLNAFLIKILAQALLIRHIFLHRHHWLLLIRLLVRLDCEILIFYIGMLPFSVIIATSIIGVTHGRWWG